MISQAPELLPLARTPAAGVGLINGTQTLVSGLTTPNDGQLHQFTVGGLAVVTVAETGGQLTVSWRLGGSAQLLVLDPGGHGTGQFVTQFNSVADPGTAIAVTQNSALSLGTAVWFGSIALLG